MRKNNLLLCICTILALLVAIPDSAMAGGDLRSKRQNGKSEKTAHGQGKGRKGKR